MNEWGYYRLSDVSLWWSMWGEYEGKMISNVHKRVLFFLKYIWGYIWSTLLKNVTLASVREPPLSGCHTL